MGKRLEGLQRMLVIVNKLKGNHTYISSEELERHVAESISIRGYLPVNFRTLQRDIVNYQRTAFRWFPTFNKNPRTVSLRVHPGIIKKGGLFMLSHGLHKNRRVCQFQSSRLR